MLRGQYLRNAAIGFGGSFDLYAYNFTKADLIPIRDPNVRRYT
jgi:hypothetical protein